MILSGRKNSSEIPAHFERQCAAAIDISNQRIERFAQEREVRTQIEFVGFRASFYRGAPALPEDPSIVFGIGGQLYPMACQRRRVLSAVMHTQTTADCKFVRKFSLPDGGA